MVPTITIGIPVWIYGFISNAVRLAVRDLPAEPSGVSPQEVLHHIHRAENGRFIDITQVRTALKVMVRNLELRRVDRGRYAPARKLAATIHPFGLPEEKIT